MPYSSPAASLRTWHVVVFLGLVILVADIVSLQMLGTKTNQFQFTTAPAQPNANQAPTVPLPPGTKVVAIPWDTSRVPGAVVPGSRVNVNATLRIGNTFHAFPLLVDVLVVAVDSQGGTPGAPTQFVSFATTEKQSLALALAKQRSCDFELLLRNPARRVDSDMTYDIDAVTQLLIAASEWGGECPPPTVRELAPAPRPVADRR